jgi:hypothetical protein
MHAPQDEDESSWRAGGRGPRLPRHRSTLITADSSARNAFRVEEDGMPLWPVILPREIFPRIWNDYLSRPSMDGRAIFRKLRCSMHVNIIARVL